MDAPATYDDLPHEPVMLLLLFGEYLGDQGLVVDEQDGGDDRSYEALARDFLVDLLTRRAGITTREPQSLSRSSRSSRSRVTIATAAGSGL